MRGRAEEGGGENFSMYQAVANNDKNLCSDLLKMRPKK